VKIKEVKIGWTTNLPESSLESHGSGKAVFSMMMVVMMYSEYKLILLCKPNHQ
jgi:hypothetical protein